MLIARRFIEILGGVSVAQRWLDRIETLLELFK
jgi:hypothetical protein